MASLFCGHCGRPVQPDWICCGHCGAPLPPREPTLPGAPAQPASNPPETSLPPREPTPSGESVPPISVQVKTLARSVLAALRPLGRSAIARVRATAPAALRSARKRRWFVPLVAVVVLAVGSAAVFSLVRTKEQNQLALAATWDYFVRASADWPDSLTLQDMRVLERSRTGQVLVEFTYTDDAEPAQEPTLAWMVFQSVTEESYSVTPEAWTPQYWEGAGPDVAKSQNDWDSTPSSMVTTYPLGGEAAEPADPDTFFARWSDTIDAFAQANTQDGVLDETLAQFLESCRLSAANFAEGRGQGQGRYYFQRDEGYTLVLVSNPDGVFTSGGVTCSLAELTEDFSMAQIQSVCMAQGLMPEATPEQTYENLLSFFQTLEQGTTQEVLWQRLLLRGYVDAAGTVQLTLQLQ